MGGQRVRLRVHICGRQAPPPVFVTTMIKIVIALLLALATCAQSVRDDRFYRVLGISTDADDRTIKKAYKKQAL